jgi:hypothetical protein
MQQIDRWTKAYEDNHKNILFNTAMTLVDTPS